MCFGTKTGKFVRMLGQWKYENSQRKILRNKTEISSIQTMMSYPYSFSKISCFRFSPIPLITDNQLWRKAYKSLWFSISSRFSPCFSTKWTRIAWCIEIISITLGGGGEIRALYCSRAIKTNPQNYLDFKILWSLYISLGRKTDPSPQPPSNPTNQQKTKEKH